MSDPSARIPKRVRRSPAFKDSPRDGSGPADRAELPPRPGGREGLLRSRRRAVEGHRHRRGHRDRRHPHAAQGKPRWRAGSPRSPSTAASTPGGSSPAFVKMTDEEPAGTLAADSLCEPEVTAAVDEMAAKHRIPPSDPRYKLLAIVMEINEPGGEAALFNTPEEAPLEASASSPSAPLASVVEVLCRRSAVQRAGEMLPFDDLCRASCVCKSLHAALGGAVKPRAAEYRSRRAAGRPAGMPWLPPLVCCEGPSRCGFATTQLVAALLASEKKFFWG